MSEIKLDYPAVVDGEKIERLNMRRPKVLDQKAANKSGTNDEGREITLFANLCDVDTKVIDELDLLDYQKLQETYTGFLSPGTK